jgi:transposase
VIRGHDLHRRHLVPDQLWRAIQPLLPTPPRRYGGRPRIDDRAALAGIVYQLRTGIPLAAAATRQLGCGSPVTGWRRLRDWQRVGGWQQLHHLRLDYPRRRWALRRRGTTPRIARRGIESSQRLGRHRYVVERSLAWLVGY